MKKYTTKIMAIDPEDRELKQWGGPVIDAPSWDLAHEYCKKHLGYCEVDGELIAVVETKSDGITPDWDKMIDYDNINKN
jgi:hypothetical protein